MATILSRRLTRDKLALFLRGPDGKPLHELIKAFENLFADVSDTIPEDISEGAEQIEAASLDAGTARSEAAAAVALAVAVSGLADALASAPADHPHTTQNHDCQCDQLPALREEVAQLRSQVQALQLTPN